MAELSGSPAVPEPEETPVAPVQPRDAATVMLVRDNADGMEVFLQRRVTAMAFAGGMTVYPGGGVDRGDVDTEEEPDDSGSGWTGPPPEWWARRFGCSVALARGLVHAAVRETFEESGVLLAGPDADSVVRDTSRYQEHRHALEDRELSFAEFLRRNGLVLRADLLRPWANWVTPEVEPRRYDARFFLAALPPDQHADAVTSEAVTGYWSRPENALRDWRDGRCSLMPPTWASLRELAEHRRVADALAAERDIHPVIPRVRRQNGALHIVLPWEDGYDEAATHLPPRPDDAPGGST